MRLAAATCVLMTAVSAANGQAPLPPPSSDPLAARAKGRSDAPVTVYEMSDFQCPYCRSFALTTMPLLEKEYVQTGKVRFVYINLPLTTRHPNAAAAAELAMCAARQGKFWPLHDLLFQHQDAWAPRKDPAPYLLALGDSAGPDRARLAERALPLAARFDKKIARGVDARRGVLERLAAWGRAQRDPKRPLVWVHAPSVGEGLQAKPVLETLRAERPQWQLVYTFFSPSAERLARTLPVDLTDYLPFDRAADVAAALDALQPAALVFSKLLVWVHAPSVGEGLQAKPVLETLRAERPQWQLVYTFFSPSAERLARTLPVDLTDYLPFDRAADVAAALDALQPAALVFSKLDVWPELTLAARRRGTKLGLISATVALDSSRLRWPARRWAEPAYRALDRVGTISEDDGRRLQQLGARREVIEVTGDTRYDSVAERAERFDRAREPFARLAAAPAGTFTIVAGSTWPADEAVVLPALVDLLAQVPTTRLILAPHGPNPDQLALIAERARHFKLPRPVRLSQLEHAAPCPVVVVARAGGLADLYGPSAMCL